MTPTHEEKLKRIGQILIDPGNIGADGVCIAIDTHGRYIVEYSDLEHEVFCYTDEDLRIHSMHWQREERIPEEITLNGTRYREIL